LRSSIAGRKGPVLPCLARFEKPPGWLAPKIRQLGCSPFDPLERVIQMPELSATCPTTRKRLSTGIHTDSTTLAKVWSSDILKCPHCGKTHAIKVREAYVESALSSDGMRDVRVA
jgi:hypothetical protein